ncbi:MAG: acyl carrier protein [Candidatus Margulisiibacteriota bacterium]
MISDEQLTKEIRSLVSKVIKLPEEKVYPDANLFTDLGVDSLLGVEIIASLDKKYGLDVPEEKLKDINTLNDVIALVKDFLSKKSYRA